MRKITVELDKTFDIYLGEKELNGLGKLIAEQFAVDKIVVIMEAKLKKFYMGMVSTALAMLKIPVKELCLDLEGIDICLDRVEEIVTAVDSNGITASSMIIAVGNTPLIDLVGFACALIGDVKFTAIPTTLPSMVDANFEGKHIVYSSFNKRQLTIKANPAMMYIDTCFLTTLQPEEYSYALAFVSKVELLKGMGLLDAILQFDMNGMYTDLICECIKLKYGYLRKSAGAKSVNMLSIGEPYTSCVRDHFGGMVNDYLCQFYGVYLVSRESAKAHLGAGVIVETLSKLAEKYNIDLSVLDMIDLSPKALCKAMNGIKSMKVVMPYGFGNCMVEDTSLLSPVVYSNKVAKRCAYDIRITNSRQLAGDIEIFNSMAVGHYMILLSSFSATTATITRLVHNDDNQAVINALRALGFSIIVGDDWCEITQGDKFFETMSGKVTKPILVDAKTSESIFSTMLCVGAMMGLKVTYKGDEKLLSKSMKEQIMYMRSLGIVVDNPVLPFTVKGYMDVSEFNVNNKTNEQFLMSLIVGAFCVRADIVIKLASSVKNSPSALLILDIIKKMGAKAMVIADRIELNCSAVDILDKLNVKGDSANSNLACWMTMKAMGAKINFANPVKTISKVDKALIDFINKRDDANLKLEMDISNSTDIAPYLAVMNMAMKRYYNLRVTTDEQANLGLFNELIACIHDVGGKSEYAKKQLSIYVADLKGGEINSYCEPRLVMAFAALSIVLKGEITIRDAHHVATDYPTFWEDFGRLGGEFEVLNAEELSS